MVFFSGGKGGGEEVAYGYKGKGVTGHLLVDGNGSPVGTAVPGRIFICFKRWSLKS